MSRSRAEVQERILTRFLISQKTADDTVIVLLGASGDLAAKKLVRIDLSTLELRTLTINSILRSSTW